MFNENRSCIEIAPAFDDVTEMAEFNENRSCIEIRNSQLFDSYHDGLMKTEVVLKFPFVSVNTTPVLRLMKTEVVLKYNTSFIIGQLRVV